MKSQAITTMILLAGLAAYFGYWGVQFIVVNPASFEAIIAPIISISCIFGIAEQYRNNIKKTKKS